MADNPGISSGDTIILDDKPMRQVCDSAARNVDG